MVKSRGSLHGANESPFLIDEDDITMLLVTSLGLQHQGSTERVPTGVLRLDTILGNAGFYWG
jgi:circadian clock protein KaiC